MELIKSIDQMKAFRNQLPGGSSLGFVPTMGALHEGHAQLLRRSKSENDQTVLSIFVNRTQFNETSDFEKYPSTLDADLALARREGVDAVLLPNYEMIYPDNFRFRIQETEISKILCGAFRPGHFDGVLTVVLKLLQIVLPRQAYFGEKDYQQALLIQQMSQAFFLSTNISMVPTYRENTGLAYSSRNERLSAHDRMVVAPNIYRVLSTSESAVSAMSELIKLGFEVEYLEDHFGRRLVAAWLSGVRLIDNVVVRP